MFHGEACSPDGSPVPIKSVPCILNSRLYGVKGTLKNLKNMIIFRISSFWSAEDIKQGNVKPLDTILRDIFYVQKVFARPEFAKVAAISSFITRAHSSY